MVPCHGSTIPDFRAWSPLLRQTLASREARTERLRARGAARSVCLLVERAPSVCVLVERAPRVCLSWSAHRGFARSWSAHRAFACSWSAHRAFACSWSAHRAFACWWSAHRAFGFSRSGHWRFALSRGAHGRCGSRDARTEGCPLALHLSASRSTNERLRQPGRASVVAGASNSPLVELTLRAPGVSSAASRRAAGSARGS
jgi:hypothetical protein